jgi:hypothetical protein
MENMPSREKITTHEAAALKQDLLGGGLINNTDAAEIITVFLANRGYGVDHETMLDLIRSANQESLEEFKKKLGESALEN